MARYDEPGFVSKLPGLDLDARSYTASGSVPSRTEPPDSTIPPGSITGDPSGISYELAGPDGSAKSASPQVPGQCDATVISPGADQSNTYTASSDAYTSTGAGRGHNFTDQRRYDYQQKPGG